MSAPRILPNIFDAIKQKTFTKHTQEIGFLFDKTAGSYEKLRRIFNSGVTRTIHLEDQQKGLITVVANEGATTTQTNAVFTPLKKTILFFLTKDGAIPEGNIANFLWGQFDNPGFLIDSDVRGFFNYYTRRILAIRRINEEDCSVDAKCVRYSHGVSIERENLDDYCDVTIDGGRDNTTDAPVYMEVKLALLEKELPSVTQRIKTALVLGLSPEEVATSALIKYGSKEMQNGPVALPFI